MGTTWLVPAWLVLFCGLSRGAFRGREFLAAFPQNDDGAASADLRLLVASYLNATRVTVTARGASFSRSLTLGPEETTAFRLPAGAELVGNHLSRKAVLIRATEEISVLALNSKSYTVGATAVLPVEQLGTEYYVVTPEDKKKEGLKEFVVAAWKTSATVSIQVEGKFYYRGRNYPPGSTLRLFLDPFHAFQLQSAADLSGSRIAADAAVAVFAGHTCVKVRTGCDHVVEQLLPVSSWGTAYVVPPNPFQRESDFAYVVAAEKGPVTYRRGSLVATKNFQAGEVHKFEIRPNSPLYVTSPVALQVVFFFTGASGSLKRDPFLLNVPPVSAYCTSYRPLGLHRYQNHAVLVARTADADATTLNQKEEKTASWQAIPGTDFSWATVTTNHPKELQSAENPRAPFGLLIFGFQNYAGYGFAGLCATTSAPLSCEDLRCEEKCEMVDGQPACIQEALSTCRATGHLHYQTFDGKTFDFAGTCTYTLTKTCDPDPALPLFSVEAKNEDGDNPEVPSVGAVTVRVYDVTVVVVRAENGIVRVDNRRSRLPVSLARGKLRLQQKGKAVLIRTDFRLEVLYDWRDRLVVKLPAALAAKACGMCGGGDGGDPGDDAPAPDADPARDAEELGRRWKVTDESRRCRDGCGEDCGRCRRAEGTKSEEEEACGLLTRRPGPFEGCHSAVDPQVYLKNCAYDLCVNNGLPTALCRALEAYADRCREEGIALSDWRTAANCPLSCPENSNYTSCGTSCPTTCNAAAAPTACAPSPCVETCRCQEGFAFDANRCVPQTECGCLFEGLLHGPGEEFWGDSACGQRCVCQAPSRRAVCRRAECRPGEECRVEGGVRDCYPKSYGTCAAVGAAHYETFDGGRFTFQGTCVYQLAGSCEKSQGLVDFQVAVRNGGPEGRPRSSVALVMVKAYGKTIVISRERPGEITINGRRVRLPYRRSDGKISAYRGGWEAVVETDFGLTVAYDWRSRVTATVPSAYAGALCGLCGNYNGDAGDEMMMKNGRVTSNPDAFGHSWKVTDVPGCVEDSKVECPTIAAALSHQEVAEMGCGIIRRTDGPFGACHAHVDPAKYFQSCALDFCLFPDGDDAVCAVIAAYAAACQAAGATIGPWRTDDFCGVSCPTNSRYQICSQTCSHTCGDGAPGKCSGRCREGCECDRGFVLSGDECVPPSRCGCHHQDFYYKAEETFFPNKQEKCRCRAGGAVDCQEISCPEGSEGEVIDGVFRCSSATLGTCVATGDRSYISFDGMAFNISGACSYVLTETCSGENVQPLLVKIEKEARQKRKVSGVHALTVEVYGMTLTLRRGKRGEVMVDSISHHLPVTLSEGRVWVHQHGTGVLLQTDFGLVVRYDLLHHVTLTLPQSYRGHLCGLCGNYNGQRRDDLLLPGDQQAPDATVFGSAWKTPDASCGDDCSEDHCPVCTREKVEVLQRPNYCGLLALPEGPFGSCHHLIDPTFYFRACLHDLCLAEGDTQVLCQSIQSYATACQDAGVIVEGWRRPSFCPLNCPANSSYSLCTNLCLKSCAGLGDASECPKTCVEGCDCEKGYRFDGHGCVPEEDCGCFVDGKYYKPHESVLRDNCQRRCTCVPGRGLACGSHSCTDDETCEIRDGLLGCINRNPCKALRCRPKERCKLKDGQAKCVPSLVATCWAWGDPHYHTFDGLDFDFQGTCTYTMARSCGNDTGLVPFTVEAKNDIRGGVKSVSYVSLANVKVYGQHVSIRRREVGKVRVNGVSTLLPVSLEDGRVAVLQSGLSAVLETDFGLRVTYDWNWHLLIDLPSAYYKHTCGLCGDFNLKPEDDVPQSGGGGDGGDDITAAAAVVAWAESWKVPEDDDPFCWDYCEGACPVCEEEKKELYGGNRYCGLIRKSFQGPFKACHGLVPPRDFYRNCLYDVCMSDGAKKILCRVLESYAATCMKHGAALRDWRTPAGCPLPCPENSHYEACGNACPATCANREAPAACSQPCVETCACNEGYVLSGGQCVAAASCGCTRDGRYYRPGEEFWADETCRSRCRCDAALGMVVCQEGGCKPGEGCALVKGVRRCVAKRRSTCVATGDPHYTTFDGRRYDFMGTCVYQLAALCSDDPALVPFTVTVENNNRGSRVVSYTKEVTLEVYNMTLSLSQEHPQKLKVNGILVDLPFDHAGKLRVYLRGVHGFVETDFEVAVTFDWHSYARVILPDAYSGAVCGLCGDADGDPADDLALPDGQPAPDEIRFADSWKVADVPGCSAACADGCRVCGEAEKRPYRGDKHCGLLVKERGPFAACHGAVDPAPYFHDCLFDTCLYQGHQETVCRSVAAYVAACQSRGAPIGRWRTAAFCSPVCPPNQHYELCGPACPPTCRGQEEPEECEATADATTACAEGCYCDAGFLRSGASCVPLSRCGCLHEGRYYPLGEEFVPSPACDRRCVCRRDGAVECWPEGCVEEEEICDVRDGVRGCHPRRCMRCQVLGAAAYSAFDGRLRRFAGACAYTLAAAVVDAEGPEDPLVPFVVEVEKEKDPEKPLIRRLVVTVHGVTVAMDRGTRWEVTVGGERHLLPLSLARGALTVTQEGAHRLLRVAGGPKLLYADAASYAVLTLPSAYRRHRRLAGLCGDFDGAADAASHALGAAWGTPAAACAHDGPPPACPTASPGLCGLMAEAKGPFGGCHGAVAPAQHVAACLRERCGGADGGAECRSLQAYAAACQAAGGRLQEWREAAGCPLSCPPNSHYELCARSCDRACASLSDGPRCGPKCFEGCQCDEGFLFNGDECVPAGSCGCLHRGRYFEIAETVLAPDCSESCTCRAAGGMQCRPAGCPFGQTCGLKDGVRGCVEQRGRCTLAPASRFVSFDGATTTAATAAATAAVYVVASLCAPLPPTWFRLLAAVGDNGDRPAVVALHLFTPTAFLTLKRDKKLWVNGVPATLPVEISDALTINETRGTIWVTQEPQFVIGFSSAGEVTVTVTRDLSKNLCGMCGDYDGDAANDLRGPDGKLVADVEEVAEAWRAPDFTH